MATGLNELKDLLEKHFIKKNKILVEKGKLDDIKNRIYNGYLNENFERNTNVRGGQNTKVIKEFFNEADKYEKEYMENDEITFSEMAEEGRGNGLDCANKFVVNFKRNALLKDEIQRELISSRASFKKTKNKKYNRKSKKISQVFMIKLFLFKL